jgi:hypothetical protein
MDLLIKREIAHLHCTKRSAVQVSLAGNARSHTCPGGRCQGRHGFGKWVSSYKTESKMSPRFLYEKRGLIFLLIQRFWGCTRPCIPIFIGSPGGTLSGVLGIDVTLDVWGEVPGIALLKFR